jgi:hypothetical protein
MVLPESPSPVGCHDGMVGPEEVLHHLRLELRPVGGRDVPEVVFNGSPEMEEIMEGVGCHLLRDDGGEGLLRPGQSHPRREGRDPGSQGFCLHAGGFSAFSRSYRPPRH